MHSLRGPAVAFIAWQMSLLILAAWFPFKGRVDPPSVNLDIPSKPIDIIGNLLLLCPVAIGCLVGFHILRRPRPGTRAFVVAVLLGLVLESSQWFVKGRTVAPTDVMLNAAGAGVVIWVVGSALGRRVSPNRVPGVVGGAIFLGVLVCFFYTFVSVRAKSEILDWDPAFKLRTADEVGGRRAYLGRITNARICSRTNEGELCLEQGADANIRRRLTTAAESSQFVELAASVRSESNDQRGPARIITFSWSTDLRNATLAQLGKTLTLRVRTPLAGQNGARVSFGLPDAVEREKATEVRAVFRNGGVTLQSTSDGRRKKAAFQFGLVDSWWLLWGPRLIVPSQVLRVWVVSTVALCLPIGYGLALLCRARRVALLAAILGATVLLLSIEGWQTLPVSRAGHFLITSSVISVGAVLVRRDSYATQPL